MGADSTRMSLQDTIMHEYVLQSNKHVYYGKTFDKVNDNAWGSRLHRSSSR